MEFEDVSEEVEWEARRMAAALGAQKWDRGVWDVPRMLSYQFAPLYTGSKGNLLLQWSVWPNSAAWHFFHVEIETTAPKANYISVQWDRDGHVSPSYHDTSTPEILECVVRTLNRLGVEDEELLSELNYPLTAHEKLELRLSMPREFWPSQWLEGEEPGGLEGAF